VAHPEHVALQEIRPTTSAVYEPDVEHPVDVLSIDSAPGTVTAPYRGGTVLARRNTDGGIDLLSGSQVWPLVDATGASTTALRADARSPPGAATTWAFLGPPPEGFGQRSPWQLRLATPRDNLIDGRILVRRDRTLGAILLGFAAVTAGAGVGGLYWGSLKSTEEKAAPFVLGGIAVTLAAVAAGVGLHELLLRERDDSVEF
jgi:hypothetical protein